MKKVKNQRKKTAIGQKRFEKSLKRKNKKYNPVKRYYVVNDRAVQETTVSGKPLVADTQVLDLS